VDSTALAAARQNLFETPRTLLGMKPGGAPRAAG